jgi:hypothetical protein
VWFTIWEDSAAWVCVRRRSKSRGPSFKLEAHLDLWGVAPAELVRRLEETPRHAPRRPGRRPPPTRKAWRRYGVAILLAATGRGANLTWTSLTLSDAGELPYAPPLL